MSRNSLMRSVRVLIVMIGLGFLGTRFLSTPDSNAALLTFQSPIGDPQLSLVKTVDDDSPQVGDEIVYTLTYSSTNPGSQAFDVRLYDFLPAGVQFLGANPAPTSSSDGVILFSPDSVGPTAAEVTVRARVLAGHNELYNHALLMAEGVAPAHDSLLTNVTALPLGRLSLTKVGYPVVLIDDEQVFTLHCENTSDVTVNDVTVVDVLPTGWPVLDTSPPPQEVTLPTLRWSLGDLSPGESRTIVITTTTPASAGMITNTALADTWHQTMTQATFATLVVAEGAILRVTKMGSAPEVDLGDELVYTLHYENAGNQLAGSVTLTDTFPSDITVTGVLPSTPDLTSQRGVWDLGALDADESGTIVITATVGGERGRVLHNVVDITAPGSYPGHAELDTPVRLRLLYLPLVVRNY